MSLSEGQPGDSRGYCGGCGSWDPGGQRGAAGLRRVAGEVEAGVYKPYVDRVFGRDEIVAAHRYMDGNEAAGKLVMVP
jgi:NADPH:quinone reductase-like Zn-dependent oxidoreductase